MHAGIDQLLSLRDGEPVSADTIQHVDACAICGHELSRLRSMRNSLRALPKLQAPHFDLSEYSFEARARKPREVPLTSRYAMAGVLAAAIAAIAIALAINFTTNRATNIAARATLSGESALNESPSNIAATETTAPLESYINNGHVVMLANQSRHLERLLSQLPDRPHVERAGTAGTIDTLQQRIQWVDYQLSVSNEVGLNEQQSTQLWQDRVTLMDSLIKVRFAEAQRFAALL